MRYTTVGYSKSRRKISTTIKFLVNVNALPAAYKQQLHASQISRYKNHFNIQEYVGHDLVNLSDEVISALRKINEHKIERKIIYGFLRLTAVLRKAFNSAKQFHKVLSQSKDQIVEAVQRLNPAVPVAKCAKLIGICSSTLRNWITAVRVRCSGSLINICRKVHPNQLLAGEVYTIHGLLKSEHMKYWPLISVYYYALHNKIVSMSLSTWYKYARLLNITRLVPKSIKHYGQSIRATAPNQYWHADVTLFRSQDRVLNYIYLVVDNFSKMVLSWAVSTKLCAQIRANTFRSALKTALIHYPVVDTIRLIVDSGSENNNATVDEFIASVSTIEIKKIRALKDVSFSNSQAEAANRIIKTAYLNQQEIADTSHLFTALTQVVHDFNFVRPHGSINGLIPFDCYIGKTIDTVAIKQQLSQSRAERIYGNRNFTCNKCLF
jgi:transposase InsO family protein